MAKAESPKGRSQDRLLTDVGARVGDLRQSRGWTQQEFADLLSVSLRYIQSVEGGRRNLSLESLWRIAAAFDEDVSTLLEPPRADRVTPRRGRPRGA